MAPPLDATSQANKDAAQVTKLDHTKGGPESAYQQVVKDYQDYQKGHTSSEAKAYWGQMTSDLTHSGVLPDLSIAWAHEQLTGQNGAATAVGEAIGGKNASGFTQQELSTYAKAHGASPTDATFAGSLATNFKSVPVIDGSAGGDNVPAIFDPAPTLTASDLQSKEGSIITGYQQAAARQVQSPLFADNGALIRSLDTAANPGGPLDGNVGNNDLKAWLASYNQVTDNGKYQPSGGPFNKTNAQFVQNILDGKYNGQNEGLNSAGFSVDKIVISIKIQRGFTSVTVTEACF